LRRGSFIVVAFLSAALLVALPIASAGSEAAPGISPTTIVIGGTSPLTGPAAAYASVAIGAKAYFDSINAKGGIAKRSIDYRYYEAAADADPPLVIAKAIADALTSEKPKARYLVGHGGKQVAIAAALPDRARDRALVRELGLPKPE